jgi:hypothetical protein
VVSVGCAIYQAEVFGISRLTWTAAEGTLVVDTRTEQRMSVSTAVEDPRSAIDFIYRRRAVRAYQPNAIEERRLHALLEAAVHADARGLR